MIIWVIMLNNFFETAGNFFETYFWNGIKYDTAYNWIDTLVYSLIFVGAVWFLYDRFFKAKKIFINREFMAALLGWIAFGSAMRAAEDAKIFDTIFLVTPFHYATIFSISFSALLLALYFDKSLKIPYWKSWGLLGYSLAISIILMLPLKKMGGVLLVLGVWLFWIALFWLLRKRFAGFFKNWNFAALSAQMFDASSTFVALTFFSNFWEKHVLGSTAMLFFESRNLLLVNGSASWIMFALKLLVVPAVLFAIDKYGETEDEKKFLKMIIILLGIAIGIRNTLEIWMFA